MELVMLGIQHISEQRCAWDMVEVVVIQYSETHIAQFDRN